MSRYSGGPHREQNGWGEFTDEQLNEYLQPIQDALRGLKPGEVSRIINLESFSLVYRLEKRVEGAPLSLGLV